MPHLHRFYADTLASDLAVVTLDEGEAHHARKVARVREGDEVEVLNGRGEVAEGAILFHGKTGVRVEIHDQRNVPPRSHVLTLAMAWLNREKSLEELAKHATELGVARIVFFRAARSERPAKVPDKFHRLAVEAMKQCGQPWLPHFEATGSLEDALALADGARIVAAQGVESVPLPAALAEHRVATAFIGPEGDFTSEELEELSHAGAQSVILGAATLRSEVAAVTLATLIQYEWGYLNGG